MQEKQYALAAFMEIQGTFNLSIFTAIQGALEKRNVGKTIDKVDCEYAEAHEHPLNLPKQEC